MSNFKGYAEIFVTDEIKKALKWKVSGIDREIEETSTEEYMKKFWEMTPNFLWGKSLKFFVNGYDKSLSVYLTYRQGYCRDTSDWIVTGSTRNRRGNCVDRLLTLFEISDEKCYLGSYESKLLSVILEEYKEV